MKIHLIEKKAVPEQMREMLESLESYIKLAVDIENEILAGGGTLHSPTAKPFCWKTEAFRKMSGARISFRNRRKLPLNRLSIFARDSKISVWKFRMTIIREKIKAITENLLKGVEYE